MAEPAGVYARDGDRYVPAPIARGPWNPHAQHGGAPAALLAHLVERFEPGPATFVARITIELLRPVPLVPLQAVATMLRPGKKVQLVGVSLVAGDVEVVRATALRMRELDLPLPDGAIRSGEPIPGPDEARVPDWTLFERDPAHPELFADAFEGRVVEPDDLPGRGTYWFRLHLPVVEGEPITPLQRVLAAADFGNGISSAVGYGTHLFVNPDLTVHLHRRPAGEWIGLDATTFATERGIALAESALYDEAGRIGRSLQSLLLDRL